MELLYNEKGLEQREHKGQNDKRQRDPFGHLRELRVPCLGLGLAGEESIRAAGDGAGEAGALAGLEDNDQYQKQGGEQLKNGKNDNQSRHMGSSFHVEKGKLT